jgi:NTP pyrophosphatase (non-canonical NTP hydrolase)
MNLTNEFQSIRNWAFERGIYQKGDAKTQFLKLQEEVGELAKAILKNDKEEIVDAIGDCVVVLTNLCELCNIKKEGYNYVGEILQIKIEDCINSAYNVIAKRKGSMINGTFVKD